MVHMIELTIVVFACRGTQIKEGATEEFTLCSTGSTASVSTVGLIMKQKKKMINICCENWHSFAYNKLFVHVKLRFDVCRYFLRWYAKSGKLVGSLLSACIFVIQAQVFKVVDSLSLDQR